MTDVRFIHINATFLLLQLFWHIYLYKQVSLHLLEPKKKNK